MFLSKEDLLGGLLDESTSPQTTTPGRGTSGRIERRSTLHCDEDLPPWLPGEPMERIDAASWQVHEDLRHSGPPMKLMPTLRRQNARMDLWEDTLSDPDQEMSDSGMIGFTIPHITELCDYDDCERCYDQSTGQALF